MSAATTTDILLGSMSRHLAGSRVDLTDDPAVILALFDGHFHGPEITAHLDEARKRALVMRVRGEAA